MTLQQAKWDLHVQLDRIQLLTSWYYKFPSDQTGGEKKKERKAKHAMHRTLNGNVYETDSYEYLVYIQFQAESILFRTP